MRQLYCALVLLGMLLGCSFRLAHAAEADAKATQEKIAASVSKAADFLRKAQNQDGGWGAQRGKPASDVGITGLVIHALAETPAEIREKNNDVIERGVKYVLANRRDDGAIVNKDGHVANYRTSIAIRALIAIDPKKHKDTIDAAVRYVKSIQGKDGGMSYEGGGGSREGGGADVTNTAEALEMLAAAGVKEDDPVYKRAMVFLGKVQSLDEYADPGVKTTNDGGAIYRPGHKADEKTHQPTIKLPDGTLVYRSYGGATYALLKSQLFCGMKKDDPRVRAAYKWVCDHYTVAEHPEQGQNGVYYFYYTMVRTLQLWGTPTVKKGETEHNWAQELALELIGRQKEDGSWLNKEDRWWESDPNLVTAYGIFALNTCRAMLSR